MQAEYSPWCVATQMCIVTLRHAYVGWHSLNEVCFLTASLYFTRFPHAPWQGRRMNSELRSFKRAWSPQCQKSTHAKTRAIVRKPRSGRETVSYVPGFWARLRP